MYRSLLMLDQIGQERPELRSQILPVDSQLDRGPQVVQPLPDVVSHTFEEVGVDRLLPRKQVDRVGQLNLASRIRRGLAERVEDLRRQHVPADGGQVGRSLFRRRLLHDGEDASEVVLDELRRDGAVQMDLGARDLHPADDAAAVAVVHADHVVQQVRPEDDVVAEQNGEGFPAHVGFGQRELLAQRADPGRVEAE